MKIYVDEDLSSGLLIRLLEAAGHDVQSAGAANKLGRSDASQFTFAIHETRGCLTANYRDYEELHLLIQQARGRHYGVLVVRQDNDATRDLTPKGVVAALRKPEGAAVPVANEYIVLNHWR
jgi:hypothetical protein